MNKIIDTFLLKTTIPITRTCPEGARRAVPNPGMPYIPSWPRWRRVAPIAFLWEMHVLAIHTPLRIVSCRVVSCRVARVHNTCLTPARLPQTRTAVREAGREAELIHRCTISDGLGRYTTPQDTRTLREKARREHKETKE